MRISLIWAMAENGVIGRDGSLPWHLPDEMRWFVDRTRGKPVIMGRRTAASLRGPLPGRRNLVLSRQPGSAGLTSGFECLPALDSALERAAAAGAEEAVVIGGAEVYAAALPRADRLYRTIVHAEVEGDVRFPEFDPDDWQEYCSRAHAADDRHAHAFTVAVLERRR